MMLNDEEKAQVRQVESLQGTTQELPLKVDGAMQVEQSKLLLQTRQN